MILLSHPTGNQNMRQTALALNEQHQLAEVWTCLAIASDNPLLHAAPVMMRNEILRRSFPIELKARIRTRPWREAARLACQRLGWSTANFHETGWCSVDAVYRDLDRHVARRITTLDGLSAVYAYEDGAATTFTRAGRLGLRRIYDLPIGYWRAFDAICREEQDLAPAWAATLVGTLDSTRKRARKDHELAQADLIIVASQFTARTLAHYPGRLAPVTVVPYGAPTPSASGRRWSDDGPLRVLYVGSLSQRKGLSYLFQAIGMAGSSITLTVIGSRVAECPALDAALSPHRHHSSLPHDQVLRLMRDHDVLVFPSLFEGFGLVITEAMSQGLVVITTPNTAGPDVISNSVDGFVVPIRDGQAIAERLEQLRADRVLLAHMGALAMRAAERRGWDAFRRDLVQAVL